MEKSNKDIKTIKKDIFSHMLSTRGQKYKWFLRGLKAFKYVSMNPTRGDFLESYYTLMRYVDDIVDGDAQLPERFHSPVEFVEEKIDFAKDTRNPRDSTDYLILHCFDLARKFKQEFSSETQDILSSMLFDAKRHNKRIIFPEKDLSYHFDLLDIRGTIQATLKVFGEDPLKYPILEPLGLACRKYYNLRDYNEDIKAGLINISAEDCQRFCITPLNLENRVSKEVQNWFKDQSIQGLNLLKKHKETISYGNFGLLARATFPIIYENSARKYFENVLSRKAN